MLERIKFMKVNRNKQFDYTPRYYDERKERLEKLKSKYEAEDANYVEGSAEHRARMKERMASSWNLQNAHATKSRAANIRLIIILAALLLGTYLLLNYIDLFSSEVTIIE